MNDAVKEVETLGERLTRQARRIAARQRIAMPSVSMGQAMLRRQAHRERLGARWRRIEARDLPHPTVAAIPPDEPGVPLPPIVRDQLQRLTGRRADAMLVHDGARAKQLTRERHADALTIGRDVFLGGDAGASLSQRLPLLVHETIHVQHAQEPHAAWHRMTSAGLAREEASARDHERAAERSPLVPPSVPTPPPAPVMPTQPLPVSVASPSARPVAAEHGRDRAAALPAMTTEAAPAGLRSQDLMRELIQNVRTDFERGA
jgi:hypothetical protein